MLQLLHLLQFLLLLGRGGGAIFVVLHGGGSGGDNCVCHFGFVLVTNRKNELINKGDNQGGNHGYVT